MKVTFMLEKIQMPPLFIDCIVNLEVAIDVLVNRLVMKDGSLTKVYVNIKTLVLGTKLNVFDVPWILNIIEFLLI